MSVTTEKQILPDCCKEVAKHEVKADRLILFPSLTCAHWLTLYPEKKQSSEHEFPSPGLRAHFGRQHERLGHLEGARHHLRLDPPGGLIRMPPGCLPL